MLFLQVVQDMLLLCKNLAFIFIFLNYNYLFRCEAAVKDNDFVYHMSTPELSSLEDIKGANLVKPLAFNCNDEAVAGPDIFKKLVPMKAHETASLYRYYFVTVLGHFILSQLIMYRINKLF